MIEAVGALTGKVESATNVRSSIAHAFGDLERTCNSTPFRTCYLIWKDPYLTVGGDTFIHDMLQRAGFQNVFAAETRYPEVTIESIQNLQCELLLLSSEPFPFSEKHITLLQPYLPSTKIILVDGERFSWYGSRLKGTPDYFKMLHKQL
jgi:ABC-type Fe3+-hydroxamate transport system substrate-binding protein